MPSIWEIIADRVDGDLAEAARAVMVDIGSERENQGYEGASRWYLSARDRDGEATEPLIRAVHAGMMAGASYDPTAPSPYTHRFDANLSDVIRHLSDGLLAEADASTMALNIAATFRYYRLATSRRGTGAAGWYLRAWPDGLRIAEVRSRGMLSVRDEAQLGKRIAEEREHTDKTLVVITDLGAIRKPEPNPASVMEYVDRITAAFERLKGQYDAARDEIETLTQKLEAAEAADEWGGVVDHIGDTVGTPPRELGHTGEGDA